MESDIRSVARIARRRGWIVILAIILGGIGGLLAGSAQDELYAADARLLVLPAGGARDSYNALLTSQDLAETYRQMMESEPLFSRVIERLGLDYSSGELDSKVSSAVLPGQLLIEVRVEDQDPEQAALIATTMVEEFSTYVNELAQPDSSGSGLAAEVRVSDPATVPGEPFSPRYAVLVVLGMFGGLALGSGVVVLWEVRSVLQRQQVASGIEPAA